MVNFGPNKSLTEADIASLCAAVEDEYKSSVVGKAVLKDGSLYLELENGTVLWPLPYPLRQRLEYGR